MNLDEILRRYNGGILRGAKQRLARELGLADSNISRWFNGTLKMGEASEKKVAKALRISVPDLRSAIANSPKALIQSPAPTKPDEMAEIRAEIADMKRQFTSLVRELEVRYHLERGALSKGGAVPNPQSSSKLKPK